MRPAVIYSVVYRVPYLSGRRGSWQKHITGIINIKGVCLKSECVHTVENAVQSPEETHVQRSRTYELPAMTCGVGIARGKKLYLFSKVNDHHRRATS